MRAPTMKNESRTMKNESVAYTDALIFHRFYCPVFALLSTFMNLEIVFIEKPNLSRIWA